MPLRRFPIGLVAPIALLLLIAALGALQYHWVGQVSERERDQLRQSLDRRAREFADDVDREVGRTFQIFGLDSAFSPATPDRFAKQFDEWQSTSSFAGLVKAAYFAENSGPDYVLYQYIPSSRQFEPVAWPDALAPVHSRLNVPRGRGAEMAAAAGLMAVTPPAVMTSVPAILIPETHERPVNAKQRMPEPGTVVSVTLTVEDPHRYFVIELDKDFITGRFLPALVERHFPENGPDPFRVSVTAGPSKVLYSRGVNGAQPLDAEGADASATFFGQRIELYRTGLLANSISLAPSQSAQSSFATVRRIGPTGSRGSEVLRVEPLPRATRDTFVFKAPAPTQTARGYSMVIEQNAATAVRARASSTEWAVLLQHPAGSLNAAVTQARRRNLFLSFGILGVLAASVGLVMLNARRSQKLASQQMEFVATVSHELRTPLAVIRSAAQNLSAGVVNDPSQAQRYGELIETEGRRLTDMVEQVLEYAGLTDTKARPSAKPVDVSSVIQDVVNTSSSLPEAGGVQFDVDVAGDLPLILTDEEAFRRSLHNLIGNALKYAGDGRWVGITATRGTGDDANFVRVSVADRGRGIAAGDVTHIFEPFYRGRHAVEQQIRGNGLGLSLVKHIVERHGGRISVDSTLGQGATFAMLLPIAAGSPAEAS